MQSRQPSRPRYLPGQRLRDVFLPRPCWLSGDCSTVDLDHALREQVLIEFLDRSSPVYPFVGTEHRRQHLCERLGVVGLGDVATVDAAETFGYVADSD